MMGAKSKPTKRHTRTLLRSQHQEPSKQAFIAHIHELRKRLFYVALSIGLFAGLAYVFQKQLADILLHPAGAQQFIYTTPGGGFDFQFKLCLYSGLAASIPVLVYNVVQYLHPLMRYETQRFLGWITFCSSLLAFVGIFFGYHYGLPAAMHFLLQSFSSEQIKALITINSYMNFVLVYLLGAALLFQIPLIMLFINRIKPLKPQKLFKQQRWLLIGAFVIGAIISPTPDIGNQLLLTGPIILMYELSIILVWFANHKGFRAKKITALHQKDLEIQFQRQASFEKARQQWLQAIAAARSASPSPITRSSPSSKVTLPASPESRHSVQQRPKKYLEGFTRPPYSYARKSPAAS